MAFCGVLTALQQPSSLKLDDPASSAPPAFGDDWIAVDKAQHVVFCAIVTSSCGPGLFPFGDASAAGFNRHALSLDGVQVPFTIYAAGSGRCAAGAVS